MLPSRSRQPGQSSPPQTEEPHKESHCPQCPHSQRCASRSSAGQTSTPEGRVVPCEASTELAPKSCFVEHSSELLQVEKNRALGGIGCNPPHSPLKSRRTFTIFHQRKKRKIRPLLQSTFKHLPLLMPNSSVPHDSQKAYCIHL